MTCGNGYAALIAQTLDVDRMERLAEVVDRMEGGVLSPTTVGFCCHTLGDFLETQDPEKRDDVLEGLVWLILSVGERRRREKMQ